MGHPSNPVLSGAFHNNCKFGTWSYLFKEWALCVGVGGGNRGGDRKGWDQVPYLANSCIFFFRHRSLFLKVVGIGNMSIKLDTNFPLLSRELALSLALGKGMGSGAILFSTCICTHIVLHCNQEVANNVFYNINS